jgi:hypothetical protein
MGEVMTKYDIVDETIVSADPQAAYDATVAEHDGETRWWKPHMSVQLLEGDSYCQIGSLHANAVAVHGKLQIKFTTRTSEIAEAQMIRVEYVAGAFRGVGIWRFEGVDGKTKVSYRWRTSPSGFVLRVLAPLLPIAKSHSDVMKEGFNGLNGYLETRLSS